MTTMHTNHETIVIRPARPDEELTLLRLAALDSAPPLKGEILVADVDGAIIAALDLDHDRAIADPFRHTADLVELLRTRARLMGIPGSANRRRRHSLRRPSPSVALAR
jgi:hypothetical protein